jgi:hypothetical protein
MILTGHPHSDLEYIVKLCNYYNHPIGYNSNGQYGTANWLYAFTQQDAFYIGIRTSRPSDLDPKDLIHVIRNPFYTIPCIVNDTDSYSYYTIKKIIYQKFRVNLDDFSIVDRAALSFLLWNKLIENQNPGRIIKIENAKEELKDIFEITITIGEEPQRNTYMIPIIDWKLLDPTILLTLDNWCVSNSYPTITEQLNPPAPPPIPTPTPMNIAYTPGSLIINGPRRRDQNNISQTFMGPPNVQTVSQSPPENLQDVVIRPRIKHEIYIPSGVPNTLSNHEITKSLGQNRGISKRK